VGSVTLNGTRLPDGAAVELEDDGARHSVRVTLGRTPQVQAA
jgi:hypothetical protein